MPRLKQARRHSHAWVGLGGLGQRIEEATKRATIAASPSAESPEGKFTQQFLSKFVWRAIQYFTDVLKREWPRIIIGNNPAISVEIKGALKGVCCITEAAQILCGLFEHTGRQFTLAVL